MIIFLSRSAADGRGPGKGELVVWLDVNGNESHTQIQDGSDAMRHSGQGGHNL
jgi:hypothetical protein